MKHTRWLLLASLFIVAACTPRAAPAGAISGCVARYDPATNTLTVIGRSTAPEGTPFFTNVRDKFGKVVDQTTNLNHGFWRTDYTFEFTPIDPSAVVATANGVPLCTT